MAAAAIAVLVAAVVIVRPDLEGWRSAALQESGTPEHRPAIFVLPFESDADASGSNLAYGLTVGVISDLARFKNILVYGAETTYDDRSHAPAELIKTLGIDYIVAGQVDAADERFRSIISLIEAKSGRYVWSVRSDGSLSASEIFHRQGEIASLVARSIAQPYGVLFNDQIKEINAKPPEHLTSYRMRGRHRALPARGIGRRFSGRPRLPGTGDPRRPVLLACLFDALAAPLRRTPHRLRHRPQRPGAARDGARPGAGGGEDRIPIRRPRSSRSTPPIGTSAMSRAPSTPRKKA